MRLRLASLFAASVLAGACSAPPASRPGPEYTIIPSATASAPLAAPDGDAGPSPTDAASEAPPAAAHAAHTCYLVGLSGSVIIARTLSLSWDEVLATKFTMCHQQDCVSGLPVVPAGHPRTARLDGMAGNVRLDLRFVDAASPLGFPTARLTVSPVPDEYVDGDVWEIRADTPGKPPRVLVHDVGKYVDAARNLGPGPDCVQHARVFVDDLTR